MTNKPYRISKIAANGKVLHKNHFGFLLHAQKLINGGNRTNSFGNNPKFSKN